MSAGQVLSTFDVQLTDEIRRDLDRGASIPPVRIRDLLKIIEDLRASRAMLQRDALVQAVERAMEATGIKLTNPSDDLAANLSNVMQAFVFKTSLAERRVGELESRRGNDDRHRADLREGGVARKGLVYLIGEWGELEPGK